MEGIRLVEALEQMETAQEPFTLRFVKVDRRRKTGGQIVEWANCRLSGSRRGSSRHLAERAAARAAFDGGRQHRHYANARRILAWEASQLHVREHGYNRGPEVEAYQRTTGNDPGSEWCGSFQATANVRNGLPIPNAAGGARYWFLLTSPRTLFLRGVVGDVEAISPGDRVGFYSTSSRRIGHIGCVESRTRNGFITLEGNTGRLANAGVHRLSRGRGEIYAAANWSY